MSDFIKVMTFFTMLFCHIYDDYRLQGILADFKQKSWWKKNCPDKEYKYDYIIALFEHGFSWSFMIMLPLTVLNIMGWIESNVGVFVLLLVINTLLHSVIDHLKANMKLINLCEDQVMHVGQVLITWLIFMINT